MRVCLYVIGLRALRYCGKVEGVVVSELQPESGFATPG